MKNKIVVDEFSDAENKKENEIIMFRMRNGLCILCGEKGQMINFGPVCSKHGPYEFQNINKILNERKRITEE